MALVWKDILSSINHSFDNTISGLTAATVKLALDEIADSFAKKSLSNTFTKPQLLSSYFYSTSATPVINLDLYTNFSLDASVAVAIGDPIFTGASGTAVRSGTIRVNSGIPSISFNTRWKFISGLIPPGNEAGTIIWTAYDAYSICCSYYPS